MESQLSKYPASEPQLSFMSCSKSFFKGLPNFRLLLTANGSPAVEEGVDEEQKEEEDSEFCLDRPVKKVSSMSNFKMRPFL